MAFPSFCTTMATNKPTQRIRQVLVDRPVKLTPSSRIDRSARTATTPLSYAQSRTAIGKFNVHQVVALPAQSPSDRTCFFDFSSLFFIFHVLPFFFSLFQIFFLHFSFFFIFSFLRFFIFSLFFLFFVFALLLSFFFSFFLSFFHFSVVRADAKTRKQIVEQCLLSK